MSGPSNGKSVSQVPKKLVKANPLKHSGPYRKKEIYVGNLPLDIKEEEIAILFKNFGIRSVKKHHSSFKSFAFLEMVSPEAAQLAVQLLNGHPVKGQLITVAFSESRKPHELPKASAQMPELEMIPYREFGPPGGDPYLSPPLNPRVFYAVPMEMRSSFLLHVLNDCFGDARWLLSVANVVGDVGLLVTDTFPLTPYFWAIVLGEERLQTMQRLFSALAEAETQLPFLAKQDVRRGIRCLAECNIGEEGSAWNRCWVLDTLENVAVVFFVDFGHCANIPLSSLRKLEGDEFWQIRPLAQPFVLEEDVFSPQVIRRQILEGKVKGPFQGEVNRKKKKYFVMFSHKEENEALLRSLPDADHPRIHFWVQ
ncbi:tudor domain-containing protein 10 isoform X1 [Python bivittatus]|uniref:Tudor domain-containing protein 10 isoform X1 n=1 Tax=Python bivittatus TaxID=176946 RepID=A0A9F5IQ67_PYTBI|nr:tudor domain-containing protein 10 isoform X1 [Python bivittatus]